MKHNFEKYSDAKLSSLLHDKKEIAEAAFAELYSRYSQRIYAYCYKVTGNNEDAKDVFQDTFLRFYKSANEHIITDNVAGYILTIARNVCLNFKRNKRNQIMLDSFEIAYNDDKYEDKELLLLITKAIDMLPFEYKEAFVLRQYHGLSYKEIAEIIGDSLAAVKNRVWRAKEKIKDILEPFLKDIDKQERLR